MTFQEAERVREATGLDEYEFSRVIGFSYASYHVARKRGRISHGMKSAIELRFKKLLRDVRQEVAV